MPQTGDLAPDFTTRDSDGQNVQLSGFRGKQRVVLYFFPACFTPGCDIEAQKFRDDYPQFQGRSTQVFGVSTDPADVAKKFREHFHLPFPILPDPEGKLVDLYGVRGRGSSARRVSFLIGKDGKVEQVVDDRNAVLHVEKNLEQVQKS